VLWVLLGRFTACSAAGGGETGKGQGETRGKKPGKGTDSKGYAGERRQRLSDTNPGSAGYSASIFIYVQNDTACVSNESNESDSNALRFVHIS
jgi:hypothetical protein